MITCVIVLWLRWFQPFRIAVEDPFWHWPILVLIVSSSGLATYPLEHVWKKWATKRAESESTKKCITRLKNLTPNEKAVLRRYLEEETTTAKWGRGGGAVETLARDGILSWLLSDPFMTSVSLEIYAINEVAWKHLKAHPELVDLEANV